MFMMHVFYFLHLYLFSAIIEQSGMEKSIIHGGIGIKIKKKIKKKIITIIQKCIPCFCLPSYSLSLANSLSCWT